MKIGDGNNSSGSGELLERMREAYRQEEARPVDETKSSEQIGESEPVGGVAPGDATVDATGATASKAVVELEQRLLATAESALDGAYESTDEVRRAVVEAIVTERYAESLGPAQTEQITRTLELTLSDDPVFRDEVDNMLLHAARQLARSAD